MKDGERRHVRAKSEWWNLTSFWSGGRQPGVDAVSVDIERHDHNFAPTLTAIEAADVIDALLELLPGARQHSKALRGAP